MSIKNKLKKLIKANKVAYSFARKVKSLWDVRRYHNWLLRNNYLTDKDRTQQKNTKFQYSPLISIIVPVYNPPIKFLEEMLLSVMAQTYSNWELCIADGNSDLAIRDLLTKYTKMDARIKVKFLDENLHICGNSNVAIQLATGEYIALLDHDDVLAENCLFEITRAINEHGIPDFIYTDEDFYSNGQHLIPHFKPDFAPESLCETNYITHFIVFRQELLNIIGLPVLNPSFQGAQDYDLILRLTSNSEKIVHIPKVLYYWRMHDASTLGNPASKTYAYENGAKAIYQHLKQLGRPVESVEMRNGLLGIYKVKYMLKGVPLVSIIIPSKDNCADLKKCIDSIVNNSIYGNYEILIVENNSKHRETFEYYQTLSGNSRIKVIIYPDSGFNYSKINNYAIPYCSGEYLLFLNNDTEIISPNWINELLMYAQLEEIGMVGAKLYFFDRTIQHAGIVIGKDSIPGNLFDSHPCDNVAQFARTHRVQNLIAVTGACMLVAKSKFLEVGGFDEQLSVAFNDVDLCLKLYHTGYRNVFNPDAELYHYESKTRGYENSPQKQTRFMTEHQYFKQKWGGNYIDPYYPRIYSGYNYSF